MVFPPHYPSEIAASLPEGSISPCKRSNTEQISEYASLADVPCILEAFSFTIILSFFMLMLNV